MSDLASFPVSAPTTRTRTEDPSPIACTDRPARATSARKSPRSPSSGMVHETHPATISSLRAVTSATCAAFSSAPASDAGGAARGICRAAAPRCLMVTGRRVRRRAPHGRCARDIAASAARWTDAAMDTRSGERVDRACSRRVSEWIRMHSGSIFSETRPRATTLGLGDDETAELDTPSTRGVSGRHGGSSEQFAHGSRDSRATRIPPGDAPGSRRRRRRVARHPSPGHVVASRRVDASRGGGLGDGAPVIARLRRRDRRDVEGGR